MSRTSQLQRRAIESLVPYTQELIVIAGQQFFLNGEEVFLRGISVGTGVSADLLDVDIAVFGAVKDGCAPLPHQSRKVAGTVFLRDAKNRAERNIVGGDYGQRVEVVEALQHEETSSHAIVFRRVGKKKCYIPIPG